MKKLLCLASMVGLLYACNTETEKTSTTAPENSAVELPYTASYSSSWSTEVSDADLKTVLTSYKDWETGNIKGLVDAIADTLVMEAWDGSHLVLPKAELTTRWTAYRDSLSSIKIDMEGWQKMYSTDKKESYVVVWYKETDTFKDGRVDSASWHDINQMKDGKLTWYSQFKRPLK